MKSVVNNIYWLCEGALSKDFCEFVLGQLDWATSKQASINKSKPTIDSEMRRTDIIWQDGMNPLGCIARTYIDGANNQAGWMYNLVAQEHTQICRYKDTDKGHYDWHVDVVPPKDGVQRKLSISILLSDPSDFEGGELQFKGIEDRKILTKQGSIVVFPSFVEHRVTPVTKGVRYSAVTWASGPSFR
jgi:PKHD-type hydroxylase